MQILQQCRSMALSVNIQAAQSHTKHIDPSQKREEIQFHAPEHRRKVS